MEKRLTARAAGVTKAMTLDELGRFVQQAMRDGAAGDERPYVRVGFAGGVKQISVDIRTVGAKEVS